MSALAPPSILTIDVEEWFHAHNYAERMDNGSWESRQRRAHEGVDRLLGLCDELDVVATFFVLGWLAEREPQLVRRLADAGHEIGCHSHEHPVVYSLDRESFREDTRRASGALGDALGQAPTLYRAPSFTIVPRSYWALEVLAEEGFLVDSSIFPVRHSRYGNPGGPRDPFLLGHREGLMVLPMTTLRVPTMNLPFSGGAYFRLLPLGIVRTCARYVASKQGEPVVYYFHPWELDAQKPDLDLGFWGNLRSQGGKKDLYGKLRRALAGQRLVTLGDWAQQIRPSLPVKEGLDAIPA